MILSEISDYLQQRGQATLTDIALHFDTPPDAVRGMLETWVRKGRVRRQLISAACGSSCNRCDPAATEIYQWIGNGAIKAGEHPLPMPGICEQEPQ